MKKFIVAIFAVSIMQFAFINPVMANQLSIKAEDGKVLAPFQVGIDVIGNVQMGGNFIQDYQAELSYGLSSAITIAGSFEKEGESQRMIAKALFSPFSKVGGYTIYGGYDFLNAQLAMYGVSIWADLKFLSAFVNYESDINSDSQRFTSVTPGINLKLGSKLGLSGEAQLSNRDWDIQEIRVGANYQVNPHITGKFMVSDGRENGEGRTYQTGLTFGL